MNHEYKTIHPINDLHSNSCSARKRSQDCSPACWRRLFRQMAGGVAGTGSCWGAQASDILQVNYYDSYDFLSIFTAHNDSLAYRVMNGYDNKYQGAGDAVSARGMLTGSASRVLNSGGNGGLLGAPATGVQARKYGGKELDRENGLDWLDSQARMYDFIIGRTPTMDPMSEKYYHLSPYLWCAGNPLRFIDSNGGVIRVRNGNIIYLTTGEQVLSQHPSGNTATVEVGYIYTDNGTPIMAFKNIDGDSGWDTNCHGTSFTDGRFWINNDQVPILLEGDSYEIIPIENAQPGDIIIYDGEANSNGKINIIYILIIPSI